jgi:hypothetical protein
MTKTKYYNLQMDDPQDDYDVDVVNANLKKIDEQMKTRENATDALQEPEFTVAAKRENIASKEKMPKILGKIAKFFADLKTVAFSGKYNDLDGKPAIVNNNTTTEPGSALDARQANPNIEGTMAASIAQINSNLNNVTKIYGSIKAGENLKMRDGTLFNAVYIFGKLVMISFSIYTTGDLQTGQILAELPESLQFKIEWNNLTGAMLSTDYCPFVFSDNSKYIYIRIDKTTVHANEEIRVWGIGFLI